LETEFIFTTDPEASTYALNELSKCGFPVKLSGWLSAGVGRMTSPVDYALWQAKWQSHPPVFIRHLCPVQATCVLSGGVEDLERLCLLAEQLASTLARQSSFAVQARLFFTKQPSYTRHDITQSVANKVVEVSGVEVDTRNPAVVLSIVCSGNKAYLGMSSATQNLSAWPGGECRFARDESLISRAEFKLLEAFEVFALTLPVQGQALDLGAAPGGWTRVLRKRGFHVTAVDPAELAPILQTDAGVLHKRMAAQEFLRSADAVFDLVTNDMKMDARASVELMGQAARVLRPGGTAIMTLKLPNRTQERFVATALATLNQWYEVIAARQLFHNRSEVTVALRKPSQW